MTRSVVFAVVVTLLTLLYLPAALTSAAPEDGPATAVPGTWCSVIAEGDDDFDFEIITTSVVQNGVQQTRTWDPKDMTMTYELKNGTRWAMRTYAATDVDAYIFWTVFNAGEDISGPVKPGITFTFLVREVAGNGITVTISGLRGGASASEVFEIPSNIMEKAKIDVSRFFNDSVVFISNQFVTPSVYENDIVGIYGIGLVGEVRLRITGTEGTLLDIKVLSDNYVAVHKWHITKGTKVGFYNITVEGTDLHGNATTLRREIEVAEPPCPTWPNCLGHPPTHQGNDDVRWFLVALGIVSVSIAIAALFTRLKRSSLLDQATRARIYEAIEKDQGIHFHALMRELDLKPGVLSHHINILEREKYIKSLQDGTIRRFFLYDSHAELRVVLSNIQQKILELVRKSPGIYQKDISREIGSNGFVTNYHVRILRDAGMVTVEKEGKNMRCFPRPEP